ncbi:MAG: GNAT family N-acetyltransferase [Clostridia bacterium]|nr:GNAT family N-acetyltransferase [Clostridia bacterium]
MRQLMMIHLLDNIPDKAAPEGFFIRNWTPGEEEIWVEICKYGLLGPDATINEWNGAILGRQTLDPHTDTFFVCRSSDGTPVATITGYVREDGVGDIHMVACREDARGHGIGEYMLSHAMRKLKADLPGDGHRVELTTDDWRIPAIVGYLRGGFHPVEYDEGMFDRWTKICRDIRMHGIEMLTETGERTGIIL